MRFSSLISSCNKSQKAAILSDSKRAGPIFLLAGAGSGKTFVLTNRIIYLVLEEKCPELILALTFTEAAAAEMSQRVDTGLKKLRWSGNGLPMVTTFHGLGYRIIKETVQGVPNWKRIGFSKCPGVIEEKQKEEFLTSLRRNLDLSENDNTILEWLESPFFSSQRKSFPERQHRHEVQTKYAEYLLKHGLITFGDMVHLAAHLLKTFPEVLNNYRKKYRYILVDEYQDTSPDQFELIDLISAPGHNLFLVGDDDQAIYGFRGADKQCIDKLFKIFPDLIVIKLELNYRSTANVLKYANTIFKNKPLNLRKNLLPGKISDETIFKLNHPVAYQVNRTSLSEGIWISQQIKFLKKTYRLNWSDFAILYRLNRQAQYYQKMSEKMLGAQAVAEIIFTTVHKAKGLQYPVVFLVGLENGVFPYQHSGEDRTPDRTEEERRLFYVAVTRAESILYISSCKRKMSGGKMRKYTISPFLLETGSFFQKLKIKIWDKLVN